MGLIKNKIKNWYEKIGLKFNKSKKSVAKKVSAGLLLGTMGLTSLFGFAGCSNQIEKPPVTDTTKEDIEMLKEMVKSLSLMVSQLESTEAANEKIAALNEKIDSLNERIVELEAKKNVEEGTLTEAIEEVLSIIADLQTEVNFIKLRLTALENKSEIAPEAKPSIDQETITNLENQLAKLNVRLAINNSFSKYHNHIKFGDSCDGYTAPNGDVVIARNMYNDYAYYNHDENMAFVSNEGEEVFGVADQQKLSCDFNAMMTSHLEDEGFVLDKEKTNENCYVFENEEGAKIAVYVEYGIMTSADLIDASATSSNNISITRSTQQRFENALKNCKKALKSIGLFDSYKKSLDSSLQYKYVECLQTCERKGETRDSLFVFSGSEFSCEDKRYDGTVIYETVKKDGGYSCKLDENGAVIESKSYEPRDYEIAQSFRDMCTPRRGEFYYKIALDEETGTYTMSTYRDDNKLSEQIKIKFNADLSVDCELTEFHHEFYETITYHIKEIGIERYNEVFLRINEICEQAKQQTNGLTQ